MPAFIVVGWLVGLLVAALFGATALVGFGLAVPAFLAALAGPVSAIVSVLSAVLAAMLAMIVIVIAYILAYFIATWAMTSQLPNANGFVHTPNPAVATALVPTGKEYFARGLMIGLTAGLNLILLGVIPVAGVFLGGWAFALISMGTVIFIARNRFYQGFLGWAQWLFPMSYIATAAGLLLFIVNWPFSFTALGLGAFRVDWTTGVVTSADGLLTIANAYAPIPTGGFSLGNFVFLDSAPAVDDFTTPSLPSHETGHSLNTALIGGVVLWINAVDQNIGKYSRQNLAYGELLAEGHSRAMPGTAIIDYSIRLWF